MSDRKDYYNILGVEKNATKDEIRKKFRELSKKWHPDLCKDESKKEEYEEKFKELNEAYSVLSDDEKRAEYDNPMSSSNFDFGGINFGDFDLDFDFINPFARKKRRTNQEVYKGQSLRINIQCTLEELFNGADKKIRYKKLVPCKDCHGSGIGKDGKEITCPVCGGTGYIYRSNRGWQEMSTCHKCNGSGKIIDKPCSTCDGNGLVEEIAEITIQVPKGMTSDSELVYKGYGSAPYKNKGEYGDLYVKIIEMKHDVFIRKGNDLYFIKYIPFIDCLIGCNIDIDCIDKSKITAKIKQCTEDSTRLRFKGKGMPILNKGKEYGDMYMVVKYLFPNELNEEEVNLLKELKEKEHFKS